MVDDAHPAPLADVTEARSLFPATSRSSYFNTAAVGLASKDLSQAYHSFINEWTESGLDYVRGEEAAENARSCVAKLIGADRSDVALIPSVSAAAGLVASQFGVATGGQNVVIGEREYSSNHFPWRLMEAKGYDVRQVPFRNGGLEPDDVARCVDGGTQVLAFSGVQTATGHRTDIAAMSEIARPHGAVVFVDGSQMVGALSVAQDLSKIDVLAAADHKFLMNAGRGMGYCYLSSNMQRRFTATGAGWKAGAVPFESFFGPTMNLSSTASRFDSSVSWLAAIGNEVALAVFETFGPQAIYRRNRELTDLLRSALTDQGWAPTPLPTSNLSTIVAVPLSDTDSTKLLNTLSQRGIACSARDGNLRLAVHFYNHEDDIEQISNALRRN